MSNHIKPNIWLIGTGEMSEDYVKVLKGLRVDFSVIGRGLESAQKFKQSTGVTPIIGGIKKYLSENGAASCTHAIVAVGVEALSEVTLDLLKSGVKYILVEKPGGLDAKQINTVAALSIEMGANVYVGYNRRFYASVIKAKEIIEDDGGVTSFNFEFTEWAHTIEPLQIAPEIKANWFLANSSHVVDLAFYLGGIPRELSTYTSGGLSWHPSASIFSGAGVCETGALFSYQANWESAGRWGVEILTKNHRLIFKPLEKLQIQKKGSVKVDYLNIDEQLDVSYKPGLFLQTKDYLSSNSGRLLNIHEHDIMMNYYSRINGD